MIAVRRFVLAGGRDASAKQLPRDGGGADALCGKLEDKLHNGSGLRVRLHSAIGAFAVAVGTDFALILAALHLGVLGTLGFDGHIAAVILADEILERHVHAAGVTLEFAAVKIVADGNESGVEQREHALNEVAGFNAVASEAGKIFLCQVGTKKILRIYKPFIGGQPPVNGLHVNQTHNESKQIHHALRSSVKCR